MRISMRLRGSMRNEAFNLRPRGSTRNEGFQEVP